jgi:hypothetical protein
LSMDNDVKKALLIMRDYFKLHGIKPQDVATGSGIPSDVICRVFSFAEEPSQIQLRRLVEFYGKMYGSPVEPADYFPSRGDYLKSRYGAKSIHTTADEELLRQMQADEDAQEGKDLLVLFEDFINQTHKELKCKRAAVELVVKIFASKKTAKELCRIYSVPQSFVKNIRCCQTQKRIVLALKEHLHSNTPEESADLNALTEMQGPEEQTEIPPEETAQ